MKPQPRLFCTWGQKGGNIMKHRTFFWCLFVVIFTISLCVHSPYCASAATQKRSGKRASSSMKKSSGSGKSSAQSRSGNAKRAATTSVQSARSSGSRPSAPAVQRSGKRAAATSRGVGPSSATQSRSGKRAAATSRGVSPFSATQSRTGNAKRAAARNRSLYRQGSTASQTTATKGKYCPLNTPLTSAGTNQFKTSGGDICSRPDNTSVSENATGVILKCNAGYYADTTACVICPAGSYCSNGTKTPCDYGYYSDTTGAFQCTKCSGDGVTLERGSTNAGSCINITCPSGTTFAIPD